MSFSLSTIFRGPKESIRCGSERKCAGIVTTPLEPQGPAECILSMVRPPQTRLIQQEIPEPAQRWLTFYWGTFEPPHYPKVWDLPSSGRPRRITTSTTPGEFTPRSRLVSA